MERVAAERALVEREVEEQQVGEAMTQSLASLQADEERRRAAASSATAPAAPLPACPSSPRPGSGATGGSGHGRRGGRGGRGNDSDEASSSAAVVSQLASGVGGHAEAAASPQPVLTLADAGDITGRNAVPESTVGGETTCIVCMVNPKSHLAVPCGHQCACGTCAEQMQHCPYCRAPVQQWVQQRLV